MHHGVKGQKWGIRRYQNEDGTLTPEGREHYNIGERGELIPKDKNFDPIHDKQNSNTKKDISKESEKTEKKGLSGKQKAILIGSIAAGTALVAIGGTSVYLVASGKGKDIVDHLKLDTTNIDLTDMPLNTLKTPMNILDDNVMKVNPFRIDPIAVLSKGSISNCFNCAVATDLRTKGLDVCARLNAKGWNSGILEDIYGKKPFILDVSSISGPMGSKTREESAKHLISQAIDKISDGDEYAHGILGLAFNLPGDKYGINGPVGHAVNWVKQGNKITFIDNQSPGKTTTSLAYMFKNATSFNGGILSGDNRAQLIRTDNANADLTKVGSLVMDRKTMLTNSAFKTSMHSMKFKNEEELRELANNPEKFQELKLDSGVKDLFERILQVDRELKHHGIEGQKWGKRRYQYEDGSLTPEGREHYGYMDTNVYKQREMAFDDLQKRKGLSYLIRKQKLMTGYSSGHYTRNLNNYDLPKNDKEAEKMGWRKLSAKESAMHQYNRRDGVANSKWVSADGHKEVVFTGKGKNQHITEDIRDEGTYNYKDPQKHKIGHATKDVIPYMFLGNSPTDTTTLKSRIKGTKTALKDIDPDTKKKGKDAVDKIVR